MRGDIAISGPTHEGVRLRIGKSCRGDLTPEQAVATIAYLLLDHVRKGHPMAFSYWPAGGR